MKQTGKHVIVTDVNQLPDVTPHVVYLDFETTSYNVEQDSLYPFRDCWILGIAITWDNHDTAYYIPLGHRDDTNVDEERSLQWLKRTLSRAKRWANHNIKYDAHVLMETDEEFTPILFAMDLYDTMTAAKLVDTDRMTYSEAALATAWFDLDTTPWKKAFAPFLKLGGNKVSRDWGIIPSRVMGPYACEDVLVVRAIYLHIQNQLPQQVGPVADTEMGLTKVLLDVEREGMHVDELECQKLKAKCLQTMQIIMEKIEKDYDLLIRPNVNADCYELFHIRYELPVVKWTDNRQPSYDKDALKTLMHYPNAPLELLHLVLMYRETHTLLSMFVNTYLDQHVNEVLHPDYNQCVRTGRMSCRRPNAQQLSKLAKQMIIPAPGHVLLSLDYSSIEFRILAHYLNQPEILAAYRENPDTDFHQWVADMCGISRYPAKSVNFCMAYGGGKARVLSMLATNDDIIAELTAELETTSVDEFEFFCRARANEIFNQYHRTLWRLKLITKEAAMRAKARGWVFNAYGRRRHLPHKAAFRALNTVIQSTAADVQKEAAVMLSPLNDSVVRDAGAKLIGLVHDDIIFSVPRDALDGPLVAHIRERMLSPQSRFRVPLRADAQVASTNWAAMKAWSEA